jgi:hypothetical protein
LGELCAITAKECGEALEAMFRASTGIGGKPPEIALREVQEAGVAIARVEAVLRDRVEALS